MGRGNLVHCPFTPCSRYGVENISTKGGAHQPPWPSVTATGRWNPKVVCVTRLQVLPSQWTTMKLRTFAWVSVNASTQTLLSESALTASMPTPVLLVGLGSTASIERSSVHAVPFHRPSTGRGVGVVTSAPAAQMSFGDTTLAWISTRFPVFSIDHPDDVRCQVPTPGPSPATRPPKTHTSVGLSTLQPVT